MTQGTPVAIRRSLTGHTVRTTRQEGWATLTNGYLPRVAEDAGFELLLTTGNKGPKVVDCGAEPEPVADGATNDSGDRRGGGSGDAGKLHQYRNTGQVGRVALGGVMKRPLTPERFLGFDGVVGVFQGEGDDVGDEDVLGDSDLGFGVRRQVRVEFQMDFVDADGAGLQGGV